MISLKGIIFFCFSYFLCLFLMPQVNNIGIKFGILDIPDSRKINKNYLLRTGGLGIIFTFLFSLILISFYEGNFYLLNNPIIYGPLLFGIIGFWDDISNLSVKNKLFWQILISTFLFYRGLNFGNLYNISEYYFFREILKNFDLIFTIVWIVGITNAINWTDGLDGLAAGISIIFSLSLMTISFYQNDPNLVICLIILIGSCVAFLKINFYPAKIIMGDNGSYFLGSFLSIASISVFKGNTSPVTILIPFLILFIPITDMSLVIIRRLIAGKSPFLPDKTHLHHKLLFKLNSHRKAVLVIYFLCLISSIIGTCLYAAA